MNRFFQVIKGLSANQNCQTAVGIDGKLVGHKAVMQDGDFVYQTEGFPKEVQHRLLEQHGVQVQHRLTEQHGVQVQHCLTEQHGVQVRHTLKGQPGTGLLQTEYGRIFVETLGTRKKMILCGGGHVSAATLSIARMMDFHITVVEDRPEFAQAAKAAGADEVICNHFTEGLRQLETDKDTYVIIMTRGHRHDLDCLHQMLKKEYAYLGMMGSRSRVKKIKEQLTEEGFPAERIEGIHAPIGLSIGAMTPAEIGVSIMAEVIQEKNENRRQEAYEKEVAAWLLAEDIAAQPQGNAEVHSQEKAEVHSQGNAEVQPQGQTSPQREAVLATIIARKGSAPRQIGTKMLIFADGTSLGTIGGGCMEAEVKNKARHMLAVWREVRLENNGESRLKMSQESRRGEKRYSTCFVDMTGQNAEEEGMVCGGTLEIFLEIL